MKTKFTIEFPHEYAFSFGAPLDYFNSGTGVQIHIGFKSEYEESIDFSKSLGDLIYAFNKMAGYDISLTVVEKMALALSCEESCHHSFQKTIELYSNLNYWLINPYRDYECLTRILTCLIFVPDYLIPKLCRVHAAEQ